VSAARAVLHAAVRPSFAARATQHTQVPLLLRDMHIEMRTLGAELLAVFTSVQSAVDNQLDPIQAHVPQVGSLKQQQQQGPP
jgi:hypothetical protein